MIWRGTTSATPGRRGSPKGSCQQHNECSRNPGVCCQLVHSCTGNEGQARLFRATHPYPPNPQKIESDPDYSPSIESWRVRCGGHCRAFFPGFQCRVRVSGVRVHLSLWPRKKVDSEVTRL